MKTYKIILQHPNEEILREGFKKGDKITAEIADNGAAYFKNPDRDPLFASECVMYPGDYEIVVNVNYDTTKFESLANQRSFELRRQLNNVPAFSIAGHIFLGYEGEAVSEFVKNNPQPADFFVWLQNNYRQVIPQHRYY